MKKFFVLAAIALMAAVTTASTAAAEMSASADVLSNYVWRGQKLSDDKGVVQPSLDATYRGFGFNYWANIDLEEGENTETDITLSYGRSEGALWYSVGYIHYGLDGADDTQEVYLSAGYDTLLSPSVTLYYDFDEGDGAFLVASVGHSIAIADGVDLNLGASASVNFENRVMGLDSGGEEFTNFYNGEISASVSVPLTDAVTVEPLVAWSFPLSDDAEDALESTSFDQDSNTLYGGVSISLAL